MARIRLVSNAQLRTLLQMRDSGVRQSERLLWLRSQGVTVTSEGECRILREAASRLATYDSAEAAQTSPQLSLCQPVAHDEQASHAEQDDAPNELDGAEPDANPSPIVSLSEGSGPPTARRRRSDRRGERVQAELALHGEDDPEARAEREHRATLPDREWQGTIADRLRIAADRATDRVLRSVDREQAGDLAKVVAALSSILVEHDRRRAIASAPSGRDPAVETDFARAIRVRLAAEEAERAQEAASVGEGTDEPKRMRLRSPS